MADIAFLLLIFFMVTTVFDVDKTTVELPHSQTQEELERGSAVVVVARDASRPNEQLYRFSDGEEQSRTVRLDELPALVDGALARFAARRKQHQFVVKADGDAPYRAVDQVLQVLRDRGAVNVFLLTRPREG